MPELTPEQRAALTPEQVAVALDVLTWLNQNYYVCEENEHRDPYEGDTYRDVDKSPEDLLIEYMGIERKQYFERKRLAELDRLKAAGLIPDWLYEAGKALADVDL